MKSMVFAAIAALLFVACPAPSHADGPRVAPVHGSPAGQSYGRWAAEWWQWAIGVPAAANPLLDTTGERCQQRQLGDVWFLAGSFGTDPVIRTCTIPTNTSLFFPMINNAYFAFLNDPPDTRTEAAVREMARCPEPVTELSVVVDGFAIRNPFRYFTGRKGSQSPVFYAQLPPDNLIGDESVVPELLLSPAAEEGYYLFLRPLRAGEHTISIAAVGCFPGFSQNITYNITVANGD